MTKLHTIVAEVHKGAKVANGYRVKVSVLDLGMYINGMIVYPPNEKSSAWQVLTPAKPAGKGRWVHIVEFNKRMSLWSEIYEECVQVAMAEHQIIKDVILEDIDDEPIDLSSIDFK